MEKILMKWLTKLEYMLADTMPFENEEPDVFRTQNEDLNEVRQLIKWCEGKADSTSEKDLRVCEVSSRYLIKAKKDSLGWKVTLYKRFLCFWIPDTVSIVKIGYEYKVNWQIDEWVETFKIPRSFVKVQV